MKKTAVLLVLVLLLSVFGTTAAIPVGATPEATVTLFEDDFEGGNLSKWSWLSVEGTDWVITEKDGSHWLDMTSTGNTTVLKAGHEKLWTDYTVEYDFCPAETLSYTGIFFRASSNAAKHMNGYLLQFSGGNASLYKFEDDQNRGQLATTETTVYESGRSYDVKISAIGSEIKAYINGTEIISVTDSTYSTGCIALRNVGTNILIDNMVVTDESAPEISEEVIFSETFDNDSSASNFTTISGNASWSCSNNWLAPSGNAVKSFNISDERKVKTVEFDIFIPELTGGYTGVYFNTEFSTQGVHTNGYLLQFTQNTLTFLKANSGSWASVRESATINTSDVFYNVKIEIGASEIVVKLNDATVITYADSAQHTIGGIAIRHYNENVYYDNFVVTGVSGVKKLVGQELFKDDFSSDLSKWTVLTTTAALGKEDGWMKLGFNGSTGTHIIKAGDAAWTDYALEFDLKMANISAYAGVFVKSPMNDIHPEGGYLVQFMSGGTTLYKVASNGGLSSVATGTSGISVANKAYNVKVLAYGNTITVKVDDQEVLTYSDTATVAGGQIGFRYGSAEAYVDNVRVVVETLQIAEASVEDGDIDIEVDAPITFTFNRPLTAAELASIKVKNTETQIDETIVCTPNQTGVTITFPHNLVKGASYEIYSDFQVLVDEEAVPFKIGFTAKPIPISFSDVTVKNASGSVIPSLNGEAQIDVVVNVRNLNAGTLADVYVATYANNNLMRSVEKQTVTLTGNGTTPITFDDLATNFETGDTNCQLKVFVWSNDGGLIPLTPNAIFPTN